MLAVYIVTGVVFMLVPGTFAGVMNLLKISASHTPGGADAGWIQAHGHAQIFGWLGTFILGIGYYTIPRLRLSPFSFPAAWTTYGLWTAGVALRWAVGTWPWNWRVLFPLAGVLETIAVAIFCVSVFLRRGSGEQTRRGSTLIITAAGWAMLVAVAIGAIESFRVHDAPVFPRAFNQHYLVLISWGFIVPFIWGYSTRWLPPLLGLRKSWKSGTLLALGVMFAGAAMASSIVLGLSALLFIASMRLWEPAAKEPKLRGVHPSTPLFLRIAYVGSPGTELEFAL